MRIIVIYYSLFAIPCHPLELGTPTMARYQNGALDRSAMVPAFTGGVII